MSFVIRGLGTAVPDTVLPQPEAERVTQILCGDNPEYAAVLDALWRERERRQPVLIVIDEAHNVLPAEPEDPITARSAQAAIRIAAEGRKFGLYLLVSTQRPQKVHENVLSQCDNLLLMRMNSQADLGYVGDVFSFVPPTLLARATSFRQGECLVRVIRQNHCRDRRLRVGPPEIVPAFLPSPRIERSERLVEDEQLRLSHHRSGQGRTDPLLGS